MIEANVSPRWRAQLAAWVESPQVVRAVTVLILLNAALLGLETSDVIMGSAGSVIHLVDTAILLVFVSELVLKLVAHGHRFFRSGWNVFDLIVVGVALAPSSDALSVLRALRVLRVLRLISMVPDLRRVVEALLRSLPGLGAIGALLVLIFYVFAVMATMMFGDKHEEWFGTLGRSFFTLFQIMTLENWAEIARKLMADEPFAWLFFVPFILVTTLTVLNLFVAIIVNSMQTLHSEDQRRESDTIERLTAEVRIELQGLRTEFADFRKRIEEFD